MLKNAFKLVKKNIISWEVVIVGTTIIKNQYLHMKTVQGISDRVY